MRSSFLTNRPLNSDGYNRTPRAQSQKDSDDDPDRLVQFALGFVQAEMAEDDRTRELEDALERLQLDTIRQRASNLSIPAYSITQATFWVKFVRWALECWRQCVPSRENDQPTQDSPTIEICKGNLRHLTLPSFKNLFAISGEEWNCFYSPGLWESVAAGREFVEPDKQPKIGLVHDNVKFVARLKSLGTNDSAGTWMVWYYTHLAPW